LVFYFSGFFDNNPGTDKRYILKCITVLKSQSIVLRDDNHYLSLLKLDHENIIKYFDYGATIDSSKTIFYSLMEYASGNYLIALKHLLLLINSYY
jgi:serine/threonine protein kinase